MADRTLVDYLETGNKSPSHRLVIERSAAGSPRGIVTIIASTATDVHEHSVSVDDLRRLYPATEWASDISEHARQIKQLGKPRIGSSIFREADEAILHLREVAEHVEKGEPVTLVGREYRPASEVERLRGLLASVAGMGRHSRYVHGEALALMIEDALNEH